MNRPSLYADEDQDSLFGSPPPSPARGRSPSQETFAPVGEIGIATPSMGAGGKNVGTIALPGSHMSCAELPANLPASGLPCCPASGHDSSSTTPARTPISIHTPVVTSRSSTRSALSRASSASSTRKRRTKLLTPAPPTTPITLPAPHEPIPPNFLRSQSSLLGPAGLVGSVKPARLHAHGHQHNTIQQHRPPSPMHGSTPAHPIVLDGDQDTPCSQHHVPRSLGQLNSESLRSNIISSLVKEKNIFPVLESLVKLLGDEPRPPANPTPPPFVRPYGHRVFDTPTPTTVSRLSPDSSTIPAAPPLKRRKLKHVPAGAGDWDVPFPFAVGEGPEAYRDTWARDRAKQLVTQLLELVRSATKKASVKTAKKGSKSSERRARTSSGQSSRSASIETQSGRSSSTQTKPVGADLETVVAGMPSDAALTVSLGHYIRSLGSSSTVASRDSSCRDGVSVDPQGTIGEADSADPYDSSAFEEWLSQLQEFIPSETNASPPWPDLRTRPSGPLDFSVSSSAQSIHVPQSSNTLIASRMIRDEAIDPALLAISQQAESTLQSHSSMSPTPIPMSRDISQVLDISATPPTLTYSPRASLSSLTEPLTPLSAAFSDVLESGIAHQDLGREPPTHRSVEMDAQTPPLDQDQAHELPLKDLPRISAGQKGKARADADVAPMSSRSTTAGTASTSKFTLEKQAILERARERRKQLVVEIERAKIEVWAASIENAVLVHFLGEGSS